MTSVVPVRFSGYAGFHSACIDRVLWGQVQDVGVLAEHCFRFCDSLSGKAKTFSKQVLRRTDQIVIGLNPTRATCSFSSTGSCHWIWCCFDLNLVLICPYPFVALEFTGLSFAGAPSGFQGAEVVQIEHLALYTLIYFVLIYIIYSWFDLIYLILCVDCVKAYRVKSDDIQVIDTDRVLNEAWLALHSTSCDAFRSIAHAIHYYTKLSFPTEVANLLERKRRAQQARWKVVSFRLKYVYCPKDDVKNVLEELQGQTRSSIMQIHW